MQMTVVKKNIMDEETRDEKEYLGPELFQALQQYKAMEKAENQDDDNFGEHVSQMMSTGQQVTRDSKPLTPSKGQM